MENRETAAPVCSSAHETMLTPDALLPPDYVVADNTVNTLPKPEASPPPVHPVPDNTMYALPIYNPPAHPMTFKDPSYSTSNGSGKNVVVTTQPTTVMIPSQSYERDYLGFSIFTLLFCFLPIGLVALIFSIKTRAANTRGDRPTASRNSRTALILNKTALVIGIKVIAACVAGLIYYYTTGGTAYTQTTCYSSFYYHYC